MGPFFDTMAMTVTPSPAPGGDTDLPDLDLFRYLVCVVDSERDPDMSGFAVRLSAFLINICLSAVIAWSGEEVSEFVSSILITTFSLLLCTFLSLLRKSLSVADAHFAIIITVSPLALYIVYAAVRDMLGKPTRLFRSDGGLMESKRVIRLFSLFLLLSWVGLEILLYAGGEDVFAGKGCDLTWWQFMKYRTVLSANGAKATRPLWISLVLMPLPFVVYFLRHLGDIGREYQRREEVARKWGKGVDWFRQMVWFWPRWTQATWIVITRSHPWVVFYATLLVYTIYATSLLIWVRDIQHYYTTIAHNLFPELPPPPPHHTYNLWSFGQLLAATCAIPPVYEFIKMIWVKRRDLAVYVRRFPGRFWDGVVFIVTGRRNPWDEVGYAELKLGRGDEEGGEGEDSASVQWYLVEHSPERMDSVQAVGPRGATSSSRRTAGSAVRNSGSGAGSWVGGGMGRQKQSYPSYGATANGAGGAYVGSPASRSSLSSSVRGRDRERAPYAHLQSHGISAAVVSDESHRR